MEVGVIIGRFQVPDLHHGHRKLLGTVCDKHGKVLVLIGVRPSVPSNANPLPYDTRAAFFKPWTSVTTMPLLDTSNNESWSENVDRAIFTVYGPTATAIIYRGEDGFTGYVGKHKVETLPNIHSDSGTAIRNHTFRYDRRERVFVEGMIHAIGNLAPRTLLSVDMAMVDEGFVPNLITRVVMGKKHGETLWRFPGGMVDNGESFQAAAAREFSEEVGMYGASMDAWKYVGDFNIKDWRIADAPEITHKSVLMTTRYTHGKPMAGDDLAVAEWVLIGTKAELIVPEHREMWTAIQTIYPERE